MSDDEDEAAAGAETLEALVDGGGAAIYGKWGGEGRRVGDGSLRSGCDGAAEDGGQERQAEGGTEKYIQSHEKNS
jgi:hypothetical protein